VSIREQAIAAVKAIAQVTEVGADAPWYKGAIQPSGVTWGERRTRQALALAVELGMLEVVTYGRARRRRWKLTTVGAMIAGNPEVRA
jgi:hypothetical protein